MLRSQTTAVTVVIAAICITSLVAQQSSTSGQGERVGPATTAQSDEVRPLVDGDRVRWIGTVTGQKRDSLVASARAALFPLQWEEPGGTAIVEALAPRECREQAARRFTPAVMAARYADLYEQLISGFVPRAGEKAVPDRAG